MKNMQKKSPRELYRIDKLRLSILGRTILRAPVLQIDRGGVCCLVGPNGAGKSLSLSMLAGLHTPAGGTLFYRGRTMEELLDRGGLGREITLVHQHPYMFSRTVLANVLYGMERKGLSRHDMEQRGRDLLARVGLEGFGPRRARGLSAGETARVALARALACGARTLLLDEPTASIDRQGRALFEEIITAEARDGDKTVIMSTHSLDQAHRLARKILHVREGRIGEWEQENILAGHVATRNGRPFFLSGNLSFPVGGDAPSGWCRIGIGEGDISLLTRGEHDGVNGLISGRVVSLAGGNGTVRVTVDAGERLCVKIEEGEYEIGALGIGSTVRVRIPPDKVRVLKGPSPSPQGG